MVWAIDIGNTTWKAGIFEGDHLAEVLRFDGLERLLAFAQKNRPHAAVVCHVGRLDETGKSQLAQLAPSVIFVNQQTKLPFSHAYETPHTLGMDRIAAVAGAVQLYPHQASLVVDVGTCMTLDFVDSSHFYHGGRIAPGRQMRFKAMHEFTEALPRMASDAEPPVWGNSTKACMASGVDWGIAAEVEGAIRHFQEKFVFFNVILCGGDAKYFESKIKATIFVNQHLTLFGLKSILELHVS